MSRLLPATLIAALLVHANANAQAEAEAAATISAEADLLRATGEFHKSIQEARLLREEARQRGLETARKRVEFAIWWDSVRPTAAKMSARERAAELERARLNPSAVEISSGHTLNVLLRSLHAAGERGPTVPLSGRAVAALNLSGAASAACPTMFKHGVKLHWPEALEADEFDAPRGRLTQHLRRAVASLKGGDPVPAATVREARAAWRAMSDRLVELAPGLSPTAYIEAKRFLTELATSIRGLSGPEAPAYFSTARAAKGDTVADLVAFLRREGLVVAPASPGDEPAYRSVYLALRRYEERVLAAAR